MENNQNTLEGNTRHSSLAPAVNPCASASEQGVSVAVPTTENDANGPAVSRTADYSSNQWTVEDNHEKIQIPSVEPPAAAHGETMPQQQQLPESEKMNGGDNGNLERSPQQSKEEVSVSDDNPMCSQATMEEDGTKDDNLLSWLSETNMADKHHTGPPRPLEKIMMEGRKSQDEASNDTKSEDVNARERAIGKENPDGCEIIENPPDSLKKRSQSFEQALERRKRRRRLRQKLRQAGEFPSFVHLISSSPDEKGTEEEEGDEGEDIGNEDGEPQEKTPEIVYIDVDEYLGLGPSLPISASHSRMRSDGYRYPEQILSSRAGKEGKQSTPAEEGYYEGRVDIALPEDPQYLTPLQQLIRKSLEFFSATTTDIQAPQYGRRTPIVLGKVGVRCIYCAKVALEAEKASTPAAPGLVNPDTSASSTQALSVTLVNSKPIDSSKIWPSGSVSYPMNIAGLHSLCSQKPQLHFEKCPNLPPEIKAQFYHHLHGTYKPEGRSRSREVPTSLYYVVSAKRLGLLNVQDGIRFGRDLSLDPLPLEAVLAQEQLGGVSYVIPEKPNPTSASQLDESPDLLKPSDPTAQEVLEEAMAEPDDPDRFLARKSDKDYVSDFIFLCIRQMGICHALPSDFTTRGKKTKSMRIGFAGFCCRHCQSVREQQDGGELASAFTATEYSCRSFSSEADNLASAISNSFALHLQKCRYAPRRLKTALSAFKRLHPRQMAKLEHGSQRRLFMELWSRLRAADVPEDDMMKRIRKYKLTAPQLALSNPTTPTSTPQAAPAPAAPASRVTVSGGGRSSDFPVSQDPETINILKMAEENWDLDVNDGLVKPSDRNLVSDYVFLTMRQLRIAIPDSVDIAKARRASVMAGLCCIHCDQQDQSMISPSGRTFPSQPDNYAAALNSSMYNHMQNCFYIPEDIKRALADVRKIHSGQCQRLEFGAQRRFFNILYNRLKKVNLPNRPALVEKPQSYRSSPSSARSRPRGSGGNRITRGSENSDDSVLNQFGFFEAPCQSFFCLRCRMVPLPLRARGSICFARPAIDFMSDHYSVCKEDGFDLWFVVENLKKLLHMRSEFSVDHLTDPLFKEVVLACLGGNEELARIFTSEIVKVYQMSKHGGVTNAVENYIKAKSEGLWCKFPETVDNSKVLRAFAKFAESIDGMSDKLHDHKDLVTYLLLISPSLNLQEEEENSNDSDSEEDFSSGDSGSDNVQTSYKPIDYKPRGKELKKNKDSLERYKDEGSVMDIGKEERDSSKDEAEGDGLQIPSSGASEKVHLGPNDEAKKQLSPSCQESEMMVVEQQRITDKDMKVSGNEQSLTAWRAENKLISEQDEDGNVDGELEDANVEEPNGNDFHVLMKETLNEEQESEVTKELHDSASSPLDEVRRETGPTDQDVCTFNGNQEMGIGEQQSGEEYDRDEKNGY